MKASYYSTKSQLFVTLEREYMYMYIATYEKNND